MKRLALLCVLAGGFSILAVGSADAQQPGIRTATRPQRVAPRSVAPASSGTRIAVIDVSYVFKNYNRFNQKTEQIKKDIEDFEKALRSQQKALMDLAQKLQPLSPSSPEYKRIEAEATREKVALQTKAQLKKKEVLEQEARHYYEAYQEVLAVVQMVASQNQIGLVLRFDRERMDPSDRTSVLKGVNRAVVHQANLDITDIVLNTLNR